jgi:hypothetical protein
MFLAILVGFVGTATALLTNQFGIRDWPMAPAPQVATRVVASSPQVAVERVTAKRGGEHDRGADNGRERFDTGTARRAAAPVRRGGVRRDPAVRRRPSNGADNAPAPTRGTPAPGSAPAAPQPVPPPADPVTPARTDGIVPAAPAAAPTTFAIPPSHGHGNGKGNGKGNGNGHGHGGGHGNGHGAGRH